MKLNVIFKDSEFNGKCRKTRKRLATINVPTHLIPCRAFTAYSGVITFSGGVMEGTLDEIASMRPSAKLCLNQAISDRAIIMNTRHLLDPHYLTRQLSLSFM